MPTAYPHFTAASLFDVSNKVVVISGASAGLGRDIAISLAVNGPKVYGIARRWEKLQEVEKAVEGESGSFIPIHGDISSKEGIEKIFKEIASKETFIDVLINNAGIASGPAYSKDPHDIDSVVEGLMSADFEDFTASTAVNVGSVYFLTVRFLPLLAKSTASPVVIVNASSAAKVLAPPNTMYGTSKSSALHLSGILAARLMPFKVRVNSLLLTIFPSDLTAPADVILDQPWAQRALALNPSGRFGTPEDLAGAMLFLCSRAGAYVSGSSVTLDGGELLVSSAAAFLPKA